jgi:hypothetical protein
MERRTSMRISLTAAVIAAAILCGGAILLVGLINLADPNYGGNFLQMVNSVYPWVHSTSTWRSVFARALEGGLDGAIAALIFGSLYNIIVTDRGATQLPQH